MHYSPQIRRFGVWSAPLHCILWGNALVDTTRHTTLLRLSLSRFKVGKVREREREREREERERERESSVSVSAQDGIIAHGKAHTRSTPSLSSLPKVALETVPMFVWLNTDRSRPRERERERGGGGGGGEGTDKTGSEKYERKEQKKETTENGEKQ